MVAYRRNPTPPSEAVEKRPSAALHSSFVTAADYESCLIPQDFARLASDHFSTASEEGVFDIPLMRLSRNGHLQCYLLVPEDRYGREQMNP